MAHLLSLPTENFAVTTTNIAMDPTMSLHQHGEETASTSPIVTEETIHPQYGGKSIAKLETFMNDNVKTDSTSPKVDFILDIFTAFRYIPAEEKRLRGRSWGFDNRHSRSRSPHDTSPDSDDESTSTTNSKDEASSRYLSPEPTRSIHIRAQIDLSSFSTQRLEAAYEACKRLDQAKAAAAAMEIRFKATREIPVGAEKQERNYKRASTTETDSSEQRDVVVISETGGYLTSDHFEPDGYKDISDIYGGRAGIADTDPFLRYDPFTEKSGFDRESEYDIESLSDSESIISTELELSSMSPSPRKSPSIKKSTKAKKPTGLSSRKSTGVKKPTSKAKRRVGRPRKVETCQEKIMDLIPSIEHTCEPDDEEEEEAYIKQEPMDF